MTYITTTKTKAQIESSTTKKHFGTLDQASRYVIDKLEKQRRQLVNWSDHVLCVTSTTENKSVYVAQV